MLVYGSGIQIKLATISWVWVVESPHRANGRETSVCINQYFIVQSIKNVPSGLLELFINSSTNTRPAALMCVFFWCAMIFISHIHNFMSVIMSEKKTTQAFLLTF